MNNAENLARRFHEIYERLAPMYGYETRSDTRLFNPSSANGQLMIAVCDEIQSHANPSAVEAALLKFVAEAEEHDVGGGDVVLTTCESLEVAKRAVAGLATRTTPDQSRTPELPEPVAWMYDYEQDGIGHRVPSAFDFSKEWISEKEAVEILLFSSDQLREYGLACVAAAVGWDARGGPVYLDREAAGVVTDALIEHKESAKRRKRGNPASNSDARADICDVLIKMIYDAAAINSKLRIDPMPESSPTDVQEAEPVADDWYTTETGSLAVDWSHDLSRQMSLILKKDGTVAYAAFIDGKKLHGANAMTPAFYDVLRELVAQPSGDDEDARRYRWLRDRGFGFAHDEFSRGISVSRWGYWPYDSDAGHAAVCDAAIDAAMLAKGVGGG